MRLLSRVIVVVLAVTALAVPAVALAGEEPTQDLPAGRLPLDESECLPPACPAPLPVDCIVATGPDPCQGEPPPRDDKYIEFQLVVNHRADAAFGIFRGWAKYVRVEEPLITAGWKMTRVKIIVEGRLGGAQMQRVVEKTFSPPVAEYATPQGEAEISQTMFGFGTLALTVKSGSDGAIVSPGGAVRRCHLDQDIDQGTFELRRWWR